MKGEEPLWKQRFERLASELDDMQITIRKEILQVTATRAWDPPDRVYISFCFDVCSDEEHALKEFGKGNYDIYRLEKASPKDIEGEIDELRSEKNILRRTIAAESLGYATGILGIFMDQEIDPQRRLAIGKAIRGLRDIELTDLTGIGDGNG